MSPSVPLPRPHLRHPMNKLPVSGRHAYIAPPGAGELKRLPGNQGIEDIDGNRWQWDPFGNHWDVQHLAGKHTDVRPDGEIHHGPDNFP